MYYSTMSRDHYIIGWYKKNKSKFTCIPIHNRMNFIFPENGNYTLISINAYLHYKIVYIAVHIYHTIQYGTNINTVQLIFVKLIFINTICEFIC